MKINTSRFGEIEVDEFDLITMHSGLIGFSDLNQFVLLDYEKNSPFKWLQSTKDPSTAFLIINPISFRPDYIVDITENEVRDLKLTHANDAIIAVIVTVPSDSKKITANLKAPLIFNLNTKTGKQIILKDPQYATKHLIMQEVKKHTQKEDAIHSEVAIA